MVDASRYFIYGRAQNALSREHIDAIVDLYKMRHSVPGRAVLTDAVDIAEHGYNLNISLYLDESQENVVKDAAEVIREREKLKTTLDALDSQITQTLIALGYNE